MIFFFVKNINKRSDCVTKTFCFFYFTNVERWKFHVLVDDSCPSVKGAAARAEKSRGNFA